LLQKAIKQVVDMQYLGCRNTATVWNLTLPSGFEYWNETNAALRTSLHVLVAAVLGERVLAPGTPLLAQEF